MCIFFFTANELNSDTRGSWENNYYSWLYSRLLKVHLIATVQKNVQTWHGRGSFCTRTTRQHMGRMLCRLLWWNWELNIFDIHLIHQIWPHVTFGNFRISKILLMVIDMRVKMKSVKLYPGLFERLHVMVSSTWWARGWRGGISVFSWGEVTLRRTTSVYYLRLVGWLCWGLTSQSTIFQSCRDGAIASWVINQYFRGVKCLAQGHNTAAVGLEPRTSRSGVRHSTTEPPRSPIIWGKPFFNNCDCFRTFWSPLVCYSTNL